MIDHHARRAQLAMSLLDKHAEQTGSRLSPSGGTVQNIVLETPELRRIRDLPRRDWATNNVEELVSWITEHFKKRGGTQTLKPAQAAALAELHDVHGLFAPIRVGGGKTLVSLLASRVWDEKDNPGVGVKRALLLVPASLIEKTRNDVYAYAKDWKIKPLTIESYEMLSRDKKGRILEGLRPDLIIADEAHKLKNTAAGCTRRLRRYLERVRHQNEKEGMPWPHGISFVAMSGTITTRSLREYWHLIRWALGPHVPLPTELDEFVSWSMALDERVNPESRWQPGALVRLSSLPEPTPAELAGMTRVERSGLELKRARQAYRDRLVATPGVISTKEDIPPMSLTLKATKIDAPDHIRDAITEMRKTYCTPDGHPFEWPMELWRHARELQCGFYYRWDPRPPDDWIIARTEWSAFVRETLKHSRKFATPGDLIDAIKAGEYEEGVDLWNCWQAVKPTFVPNNVPVWVDDTTLKYAANWLNTGEANSKLCWVEHVAAGRKLSEMTGIPYFGEQGCDSSGRLVDNHKGPAIVSVRSCSTGRNLQYLWHQNLYLSPMSKNDWWEQSLGRTHRDGQEEDEVTAEILMMCRESYSSMVWAVREAEYTTDSTGQPQKLTYATRDLGSVESVIARRDDELWKSELEGI